MTQSLNTSAKRVATLLLVCFLVLASPSKVEASTQPTNVVSYSVGHPLEQQVLQEQLLLFRPVQR